MSTTMQPFCPHYGTGQTVSPGAASAAINLTANDPCVRIINTGTNIAYIRTYSSLDNAINVATTADLPIPAGMSTTITKGIQHDRLAHISAAGTTLSIITGDGW